MISMRNLNLIYKLQNSNEIKSRSKSIDFLSIIISWLELRFWNITFTQEEDVDVKEIRELLDEVRADDEGAL
jgi:hypothetical protein